MAMSGKDIVLRYVCPGAGGFIAFFMFMSPMAEVLDVRRRRYIGETNALPFAAMGANCLAWLFYGFLIKDWFVYVPNQVGLVLGWFYMLNCFKFSKDRAQDLMIGIMLATVMLFWVVGIVHQALRLDVAAARTLWGSTAVGVLALYYTAPLTTVYKVVRMRDSASLNGPLCTMNVINGALWFAYGLAIRDYFIAMPNGVGAAFNVICIVLCLLFPKKRSAGAALRDLPAAAAAGPALLRLQSANFTPAPLDQTGGGGARKAGGFFDLSQFRWRTGNSFSAAAGGAAAAAAAAVAAADAGGRGGGAGAASTNSLKWLLRSDTIEESPDDDMEQQQAADAAAGRGGGVGGGGGPAGGGGGGEARVSGSEDAAVAVGSSGSGAPSEKGDGGGGDAPARA
ncbi:MAG: sugar efflux transporter for intercellular exchange-domain-containing protein [Monoraphidium minutum]|nr:MAG: sugar efflux transporter for intercellular exchange-domain-containing protein [Monoraphidium minutum]